MGELSVECSLTSKEEKVVVPFDPESTVPFQNFKAFASEMAGYVYAWPQLHAMAMAGMGALVKSMIVTMNGFVEASKPKRVEDKLSAGNDSPVFVSSNPGGLNHKDKVRRHGW